MDYDDDDYDQYRQYEDEMYKDPTDESEASDEVDSELEDTMLGHIHYSTNVYKKIGNDAKLTDNQEADSADEGNDSSKGSSGHLAEANTPAEDYFKSTKQGAEADSDTEQRNKKSSLPNGASSIQIADGDGDGEEEESKYKVERKRDTQRSSSAAETQIGQNSKGAKGAGSGSDSDMDLSDSDREGDSPQEWGPGQYDEDDAVSDSEDAWFDTDNEILDEHILDLTKTVSGGQDDDNDYDPDAELGHLDDKKFQGRGRYYLEDAPVRLCNNCQMPGHLARECRTLRCHICGARDSHLAKNCPVSTCYKCNKTGHIAADCTERHSYGNRCHKCGSHSHATEDCPKVWRVYVMSEESAPDDVVQYCYNCASLGHFGDACPKRRPMYARGESAFNDQSTSSSSSNHNHSSSHHGQASSSMSGSIRSGDRHERYRDRDSDRGGDRDYRRSSRDYDRDRDRDRDSRDNRDRGSSSGSGRDRDRRRDSRDHSRSSHHDHRSHESSRYDYDRRDRSRERERGRENARERDWERDRERDRDRRHKTSSSSTPSTVAGSSSLPLSSRLPASLPSKPKPRSPTTNPALVPTMATGSSSFSSQAPLGSHDRPIDLSSATSSPVPRSSTLSSRPNSSNYSASRLHSSLPPRPGSSNGDNRPSILDRPSFADLNAFPRGGGGRGPQGGEPPAPGTGGAQPGPMYTGGYSRRRK